MGCTLVALSAEVVLGFSHMARDVGAAPLVGQACSAERKQQGRWASMICTQVCRRDFSPGVS